MAGQGRDYYEILTVPREAARAQIERAYADLRQKILHACADDPPERIRRLSEAYEARQVLADARMRAQYDRFGRVFAASGAEEGAKDVPSFEDLFGAPLAPPRPVPPQGAPAANAVRAVPRAELESLAGALVKAAAQGRVSSAELGRLHQAFFARDAEGVGWSFGLNSRRWNRWDGARWTPGTPPEPLSMDAAAYAALAGLEKAGPSPSSRSQARDAAGAAQARARAGACQKAGDLDGALRALDEAARLDPGEAQVFNDRGVIHFMRNAWPKAAEDFGEAVRLRPDLAAAHLNLGSALGKMNRYDQALKHIDTALSLRPDFPEATAERQEVYGRKVQRGLLILLAMVVILLTLRYFPWERLKEPRTPAAPPPQIQLIVPQPEPAPVPAAPPPQQDPLPTFDEMFGPPPSEAPKR